MVAPCKSTIVAVDASEHAREQLLPEQEGLADHRRTVVVALVKLNHRVGYGDE
jgi:hypothetical protein